MSMKMKGHKTTMKTFHSSSYDDQEKIQQLCWDAIDHIETIYDYFDIQVSSKNDKIIKSSCPVHGGDNRTACNLYPAGDYVPHWKCYTQNCEYHFGKNLIGFIRGCLSHHKYSWEKNGDNEASFQEVVDFLLEITGQKFIDIKIKEKNLIKTDMKNFNSLVSSIFWEEENVESIFNRNYYRSKVELIPKYYLDRGYSADILDKYDVGFCSTPGKPMHNRCIVPIYNHDMSHIIGFSGRSIFDQCDKCKFYHDPKDRCKFFPKWRHSKGFQKEKCLYNYWYAKEHVKKNNTIIIVESPGNVWRLEEAGIHNSVAIFGTILNEPQKYLLDSLGAMSLVILMDNDEAGQGAANRIMKECSNQYRMYIPKINQNDIGDMSIESIKKLVLPYILEAKDYYK